MSRPTDLESLLVAVRKSGLVEEPKLHARLSASALPDDPDEALAALVADGLLTPFHARHLRDGKVRGFVLGPYRVLWPLGKEGMGLVYLAEQPSIGRRVALKVLRTEIRQRAGVRERFLREGRATAALDHPNIVRLHGVQEDGGTHFLVMEYVEGKPLSRLIADHGRLPVYRAVDVIRQAALGLRHAHERGVLHRDLKPSNLLMDRDGAVKLLDMGLARFYEDTTDNLTERIGGVVGSPDYIAPEQARNQADPRSDIYGLGATFYHLLVGVPPFPGRTAAEKIIAHQTRPAVPPHVRHPAIPTGVSAVVMRMLAKAPEDRYQSAAEVLAALEEFRERPARPAAAEARPVPPAPRRRTRAWRLALAALLGSALGWASAWALARLMGWPAP